MTPDDCACPCHWCRPRLMFTSCYLKCDNCDDSRAEWKKGPEDET